MRRSLHSSVAVYALLIAACLTVVDGIPRLYTFVVFGAVFVTVLWWVWRNGSLTLAAHPTILAGTLLVWVALTIGFFRSPSAFGFLRLGAFVGVSGVLLFGFSNTFAPADVYRAIGWVGASFVVVSLPTIVVGELGPLGIWQRDTLFGVGYYIPTSVFNNPNTFGAIAVMGAVGAAGELLSARTTVPKLRDVRTPVYDAAVAEALAGLCGVGVVLSAGRGAILALVVGVGVLLVIYGFGRNVAAVATVVGGLAFLMAIGTAAGLLPGPAVFERIDLSGRGILWQSALRAVVERPVFGWGPGAGEDVLAEFVPDDSRYDGAAPHSSYIRMFFIGGLVGGIGYLVLSLGALRAALVDATPQGATTAAMLVAISVILVFEGVTIFGLSPVSVMGAFTVGFAQLSARKTRSIHLSQDSLPAEIDSAMEHSALVGAMKTSIFVGVVKRRWQR